MRDDVLVAEVLAKCEVLKRAQLWPGEPRMRPRRWLRNFDEEDRAIAAALLDKFNFYSARLTDALLISSFNALGDGRPKSRLLRTRQEILAALDEAVVTPVLGENPNPTDSGNFLCRRTRQLLFPEASIVDVQDALAHAYRGNPVVFVDDFVGSGDQFLRTWTRMWGNQSFENAAQQMNFVAIYVALVSTRNGFANIRAAAPSVELSVTHILEDRSTLDGFIFANPIIGSRVEPFLDKYVGRLAPREEYIARHPIYRKYGYKSRKLLMAFEHSVPDATLPIFWSPGPDWEPLIERT